MLLLSHLSQISPQVAQNNLNTGKEVFSKDQSIFLLCVLPWCAGKFTFQTTHCVLMECWWRVDPYSLGSINNIHLQQHKKYCNHHHKQQYIFFFKRYVHLKICFISIHFLSENEHLSIVIKQTWQKSYCFHEAFVCFCAFVCAFFTYMLNEQTNP